MTAEIVKIKKQPDNKDLIIFETNQQIKFTNFKNEILQTTNENQVNSLSYADSALSNSLITITIILTIFTFLFSIVLIIFGVHINSIFKKITRAKEEVTEKEKNITKIKKEMEEDEEEIYRKLRNEELKSIFLRLEKVPEDITNLFSIITSRNSLKVAYYEKIKKLFKLKLNDQYLLLLMQFFPKKFYLDTDLEKNFCSTLPTDRVYFENEIIKITKEIFEKIAFEDLFLKEKPLLIVLEIINGGVAHEEEQEETIKNSLEIIFNSLIKKELNELKNFIQKNKSKIKKFSKLFDEKYDKNFQEIEETTTIKTPQTQTTKETPKD